MVDLSFTRCRHVVASRVGHFLEGNSPRYQTRHCCAWEEALLLVVLFTTAILFLHRLANSRRASYALVELRYAHSNQTVLPAVNLTKSRPESKALTVFVFLHIQKTGGSNLERSMSRFGFTDRVCYGRVYRRKRPCMTDQGDTWLVSRFTTGWICGVHADLTEYSECLDDRLDVLDGRKADRRFAFFTLLRDPVDRFLSEWQHAARGATWWRSSLRCAGRPPSPSDYQPCYRAEDTLWSTPPGGYTLPWTNWINVSLTDFLACPYNLAMNRQTRMLANLSSLGCYAHLTEWGAAGWTVSLTVSQLALRISAKHQLVTGLWSFGLSHQLVFAQYLFQCSLNLSFNRLLASGSLVDEQARLQSTRAAQIRAQLTDEQVTLVASRNRLDVSVYAFAKRLFYCRLVMHLRHACQLGPKRLRRILQTWSSKPGGLVSYYRHIEASLDEGMNSIRQDFMLQITRILIRRGSFLRTLPMVPNLNVSV